MGIQLIERYLGHRTNELFGVSLSVVLSVVLMAGSPMRVMADNPPPVAVAGEQSAEEEQTEGVGSDGTRLPAVTVVGEREVSSTEPMEGYVAEKTFSASKTDTPLLEIPQSISIIGKDEIAARASQSITQAVAYTPGVFSGLFGPSTRDDYFNIRGFQGTQYLDGTRLMSSTASYAQLRVDPYGLERIEVLRGPSSMLYGQNPPGGLVNMTSKRPTVDPFHEIQFLGGSFNRVQGSLDLSGPVAGRDDVLYRLVALGRGSDTQVDFVEDNRYYVAPSFTWKPGDATTFTFLSHYQNDQTGNAMQFLPYEGSALPNPNGKIPINRFLGEPGFDFYDREQYAVGYAFEHHFNEALTFRQNLRYADISSGYAGVYPDYFSGFDSKRGELIPGASFVDRRMRKINRFGAIYQDDSGTFTLDNLFQAEAQTGPVRHTLLAGVDFRHFDTERQRGFTPFFWQNFPRLSPLILDIYDPVYGASFRKPQLRNFTIQEQNQIGVYGQDQLRWGSWLATIGVRQDWSTADTYNFRHRKRDYERVASQNDSAFTYRTALTYLFDVGAAPYYSYSESFDPALGTDFFGSPFKPTTGQQHEVGVKYQPNGYRAFITAAWFHLTQQNILTDDPVPGHAGFSIQTGAARSQGVELEGKASFDIGLDASASYTYTDTEVTQSNIASELGNNLTYTPEHQAGLWLDYTQRGGDYSGLGLGGGVRYFGSNFGDLNNSQKAASYVLADTAVHYDLEGLDTRLHGMRLAVNINNLLDKEYLTTCYGGNCFYGERRSVLASLRYNW